MSRHAFGPHRFAIGRDRERSGTTPDAELEAQKDRILNTEINQRATGARALGGG
jgi:hypothetical protein